MALLPSQILFTFMALISASSLPPSLSPSTAFRTHHRPGIVTNARAAASSLKAFLPSAGDLRPELDDNPEAIISGEWTQNFSLLIYEDLLAYLRSQPPAKKDVIHFGSTAPLGKVMSSTVIRMANTEQRVLDIADHFEFVSRLPVVDGELRCLGILSKKDLLRAGNRLNTKVREIMTSPAITLTPEKTVKDGAALMLKKKIHMIPILNQQKQVIGVITRRDIYEALQGQSSA